ncbi:hypothetical protein SKAU_G00067460 [Synaphobranchus kaupii]|uniref:G-protein-signaling modulator 2 n=1 Tax=Synaphobranchus kaupii TaxID=118154 RepID=A0A9Q1G6J2_SYNKA|nr:hypothetical protein SKAU_G00067460 [Synaphobranchus kaupii]
MQPKAGRTGSVSVLLRRRTLLLARQLRDRAVEAQACYSLGNTYTLLQDYERAIDYHLKHLIIAQDLNDRIGEGRACWSLGNAHTALGNHDQAMHFAEKHLEISREIGDQNGELTARMNVSDLQLVLGLNCSAKNPAVPENQDVDYNHHGKISLSLMITGIIFRTPIHNRRLSEARPRMERRHSMENMELVKLSPDKINDQNWNNDILTKQPKSSLAKTSSKLFFINRLRGKKNKSSDPSRSIVQDTSNTLAVPEVEEEEPKNRDSPDMLGDEGFFDLLSRFQSNRMDDQRCSIQESRVALSVPSSPPSSPAPAIHKTHSATDASPHHRQLLDIVATSQSRRLDDQRASGSNLPGLRLNQQNGQSVLSHLMARADGKEPDDDFFDMLVKCQGSRLDDQRCAAPPPATKGPTVPDEDFFSLILRSQAKRIDEQRVLPPSDSGLPNPN